MPSSAAATEPAQVAASFGRQFYVRSPSGAWAERVAVTRGKRTDVCVGDEVEVRLIGASQAVIESLRPRRTALQRSDRRHSKLLAANVEQAGIIVAGAPRFSEALLVRMLIAIECAGIGAALIVNKSDLSEATGAIAARVDVYRALGYRVFGIAARARPLEARAQLRDWLAGHTTLLVGQSGMGKSTLVNTLVPDAALRTRAISTALSSGRHTTAFSRMFEVPAGIAPAAHIVDTPGFRSFGLAHLSEWQRAHAMREFVPLLGRCRFNDCRHRDEPGCAIREAAGRGAIDPLRYRLYLRIEGETDQGS